MSQYSVHASSSCNQATQRCSEALGKGSGIRLWSSGLLQHDDNGSRTRVFDVFGKLFLGKFTDTLYSCLCYLRCLKARGLGHYTNGTYEFSHLVHAPPSNMMNAICVYDPISSVAANVTNDYCSHFFSF